MKKLVVCLIAAVCGAFCGSTVSSAIDMCKEEIMCQINAVLDDSGEEQTVTVSGVRFAPYSSYFTDIKIRVSDGREIVPETNEGYGAGVAAFDFKGEGYCQLFYFASSGGSGGFGYFYVFDCSAPQTLTLFDYQKFVNVYTAEYADNYQLKVFAEGKLFVTYNVYGYQNERDLWDKNGVLARDEKPYVTELNFVEPVFVYSQNCYRLNVWQNVIGRVQVDVIGHIITVIDFIEGRLSYSAIISES